MLPYKIVEFEPGRFVVYRKIWWFWFSFKRHTYAGEEVIVYDSKADAEAALLESAQLLLAEKQKKAKFKKQVYHYREDGCPPDNWLPKLPPV